MTCYGDSFTSSFLYAAESCNRVLHKKIKHINISGLSSRKSGRSMKLSGRMLNLLTVKSKVM
jgi:hypothetical protein